VRAGRQGSSSAAEAGYIVGLSISGNQVSTADAASLDLAAAAAACYIVISILIGVILTGGVDWLQA
jgi:hypothetical protein